MADPYPDSSALNVEGVRQLVESRLNKQGVMPRGEEGVVSEQEDVLELDMSDGELLKLATQWELKYAPYLSKIRPVQQKNKQYYLGKQQQGSSVVTDSEPIVGNLLFEAEETFLPAALSKNPEPVVWSDNTPEGNDLAGDVKTMLQYHADQLILRRKLALMTRQWSIYHLGVIKHGWNETIKDIQSEVRRIQDFIFDPNGTVDVYGDFDSYLGERITITADKLAELFPKHKDYIEEMVDGKFGTEVTYTEWWTDDMCFSTLQDKVLDKHKNEYFNYPNKTKDEFGEDTTETGRNHFAKSKKPYTFLSVFSLGEQPHDVTGLIEQNIPNQNLISKRIQQIDYNISRTNFSTVFSENNFNQQTAKQAANGWAKGHPILIPQGVPIDQALKDFPAAPLADSFFKEVQMNQDNLRAIFGVQGITAQQPKEDTTARGMILNQQYDNSRIGGGIGDALEQVADNIFNWWVQLYYVYYDEPHYAAVLGQMKATEYVEISSQNLTRRLIVSVSPDSMKPKDELTQMNQALELWGEKAIDIKTLLTVLNFPDPQETAAQAWLYQTNPQVYGMLNFPELTAQIQQLMAAQQPQGQTQAPQGGAPAQPIPPEQPPTMGGEPASPQLSQVPIPQ